MVGETHTHRLSSTAAIGTVHSNSFAVKYGFWIQVDFFVFQASSHLTFPCETVKWRTTIIAVIRHEYRCSHIVEVSYFSEDKKKKKKKKKKNNNNNNHRVFYLLPIWFRFLAEKTQLNFVNVHLVKNSQLQLIVLRYAYQCDFMCFTLHHSSYNYKIHL